MVHIHLPPLRERAADLPELTASLLKKYAAKHGREVSGVASEVLSLLGEYEFPGNVRELANTLERAVIFARGKQLKVSDLPESLQAGVLAKRRQQKPRSLAEVEAEYLQETLDATRGNKTAAARILGISRKNLYERLERLERNKENGQQESDEDAS